MFNSNMSKKFLDRMFRKVDGLVWDLSTGKLGVQDTNGIYTLASNAAVPATTDIPATNAVYGIDVNPIEAFGISLPAFATQSKFEDVAIGDIVVGDRDILGWVIGKKEVALTLLDKKGMTKNYTPPKTTVMGIEGALVVKSLTGLTGSDGFGTLQGSLLPLMMLGGNTNMEEILPLLLFTQTQGAGNNAMASMLPLLMMKSAGGGSSSGSNMDMMMTMMMMGGMGTPGTVGGMNPMMMAMMMGSKDSSTPLKNGTISGSTAPALQPIRR